MPNLRGWNCSAGGFAAPDILANTTFESNFDGFCTGGFASPSIATRDTTHAFNGTTAVKMVLPKDGGGGGSGVFSIPFYAGSPLGAYTPSPVIPAQTWNRVYARFYFYFDAAWDGVHKWAEPWQGSGFSDNLGGLGLESGQIVWGSHAEWSSQFVRLVNLSSILNGWHYIEVDYWRNGDTSNGGNDYPSVQIWLDGVSFTSANVLTALPSPGIWIGNRINFGERGSSTVLGTYSMCDTINSSPTSNSGNYWIDRVALSTQRIGA